MRQELPAVAGNAGGMLRHEGHGAATVPPSLTVDVDKELGLGRNEAGVLHSAQASAIATTHKLMHLSDLHFGAHDPLVCAAVQRLAHRLRVDVVVVSGDLTQRATRQQFALAHDFVRGLGVDERVVLAGNHDLPLFAWWLPRLPKVCITVWCPAGTPAAGGAVLDCGGEHDPALAA